jgi:LmbE family N-acetylglucosaminyl deacetylase
MEPIPEDWERAVAIAAHPDDLEYGTAAAVARWTAQGKEVGYVLATSGEAGIDGRAPGEVGPLREEEERRGAALVGVELVEFLGHADGAVEYGLALRRDLAGALRRIRPDIVLTLHFDLTWGGQAVNHSDHRAVGLATLDACRDAANRWLFPELGEPWQGVRAVYVAAAPDPTHYVDVSDTIGLGVASLLEHQAYIDGLAGDFDADTFLRNAARGAGEEVGVDYAITFRAYSV